MHMYLYLKQIMKLVCSICLCTESGEPQLAMAFANRSAALFHLAEYARALVDIDQALSSGYPAELRYKLAERQAKCLMALGKPADQVIAACESAMKDVNDSRLDLAKRDLFVRDIKLLMEESKSSNRKIPESASPSLILPKRGTVYPINSVR
jgi:hypothetical protein